MIKDRDISKLENNSLKKLLRTKRGVYMERNSWFKFCTDIHKPPFYYCQLRNFSFSVNSFLGYAVL